MDSVEPGLLGAPCVGGDGGGGGVTESATVRSNCAMNKSTGSA